MKLTGSERSYFGIPGKNSMATADKDLEALRKEHKELSDHLRRGSVLILTVLSLFVISFSRACEKASGADAKNTLCQIDKIKKTSSEERNISYIFEQFDSSEATCDKPCESPSPSPSPAAAQPPTQSPAASPPAASHLPSPSPHPSPTPSPMPLPSVSPESANSSPAGSSSPTPLEEGSPPKVGPLPTTQKPTEAERKLASECQAKLEASLEDSAQKWFGVEAPIPGIRINLDLRYWIFVLPPLFFLSGIYLYILRQKLALVTAVAAYRLRLAKTEEVTEVDRLHFEDNATYMRFPGSLGVTLFVAVYLLLPVYLVSSGASFWTYWSTSSLIGIGSVLLVFTLYSLSYAHSITNRINQEIARITHLPLRRNFINAALNKCKYLLQRIAQRLNPKIPLSTGSVLVFITLVLTISQNSCEEKSYKGYQVLLGEEGAHWYTSFGLFEEVNQLISIEGRLTYAFALLLALLTLLLILIPRLYFRITNERFRKPLLALAGGIFILSTIDFSSAGIFAIWGEAVGLGLWAIIMSVWIRYSFSRHRTKRQKWIRIRAPLLVFSIPFFILAFLFAAGNLMLPGLLAYFLGVNLLFLGFMHTHYLCSPHSSDAIGPAPAPVRAGEDPLAPLA